MKIKKLATLIATMAVGLGTAWAQGTIDFHCPNTQPLRVDDGTSITTVGAPGSPLGGASVRVGLFVGPNGTTDIGAMQMVGMVTNSAATSGLFLGTFSGGNPFAIPASFGYTTGTQVAFAFAAWSISTGALTYQTALNASQGYVGVTAIGQNYSLAGGATTPPATFGTGAGQVQSLLLHQVVPEPSTIALVVLGAGALMLRRRKAA